VQREGNLTFVPDADVGDYVLIHAGFAIQKWGPEDVKEFNEIIANVNLQDGDST
jgi:hydrogenase expression/formation protein HypC